MPRPDNRSRTPSVDSVPRSSGEYNVVGPTEPVAQSALTEPPSVVVSPSGPVTEESSVSEDHISPSGDRSEALPEPESATNATSGGVGMGDVLVQEIREGSSSSDHRTLPVPSIATPSSETTSRPALGKFRASALKVIQVARMSTGAQSPGAEQGVDPRHETSAARWGHIRCPCHIEVAEYSPQKATFTKLDNQGLGDYLTGRGKEKPSWAKSRWINVGGISWDVVSALALRYQLHPLSLEDVLHIDHRSRSRADYYRNHLFLKVVCHSLAQDDNPPPSYAEAAITTSPTRMTAAGESGAGQKKADAAQEGDGRISLWKRYSSRNANLPSWKDRDDIETMFSSEKEGEKKKVGPGQKDGQRSWPTLFTTPASRRKAANIATLQELKKGSQVNVDLKHVYIFLIRDGTLITFQEDPDPAFFAPIMTRLKLQDTLLRAHCDTSLLMQAVLDLVVDKALQVVDRYHDRLLDLERQVLTKPSVKNVRQLHIMSGDLILHKRTLTPLSALIYTLRRYDLDRAVASFADTAHEQKVTGFCSQQAKVYLADVYDHMEYVLTSMDMFSSISENLIDFTFNMVTSNTNTVMKRLSIATILFFPLTFLCGYFGMNFQPMPSVNDHSELLYWEVAFPVMTVLIIAFSWNDISKFMDRLNRDSIWKYYKGGATRSSYKRPASIRPTRSRDIPA